MLTLRIGIRTASLKSPLKKAVQTAAQLGIEAVEIDARNELRPREMSQTGIRQLRKMLDDLDLKVCAVSFQTRRGYDIPDDLDRRVAATKDAMQMAYELGASVVVNQVGPVPPDVAADEVSNEDRHRWQCLVEVLTDIGLHGQRCGARLAAETGTEAGADLARLLAALPEQSVAASLNPGNLIVNRFSPLDAIAALGELIAYVRVKDAVHDLAQGRGVEVAIGRGVADFPALLAALEEHDYGGYLTIDRSDADDPALEISQAIQFIRNI